MTLLTYFLIFLALIALIGIAVFFVGIPEEWKENVQEELLKRAGESQARDMLKDGIDKLPAAHRETAEGLASGIEKISGGKADLRNPLGGLVGGEKTD